MNPLQNHKTNFSSQGFIIINAIYTPDEVDRILFMINNSTTSNQNFRKSSQLFAIRQFLKEIPEIVPLIFNDNLKYLIRELIGVNYFIVKSIYFDKPPSSNWYVPYHQDLTISVDKKLELENYGPWTVKQNQFAVQAPLEILENIATIRIHLDNCDDQNGALRVIPGSHLKKIYRPVNINWNLEKDLSCPVKKGGIILMKPLLLHSSKKTTNLKQLRVIHIEFSSSKLPDGLNWSEKLTF